MNFLIPDEVKMTDNKIIKALDEAKLFLRNRTMDGMSLELNEYDIGILQDISKVCARAYDEVIRYRKLLEEKSEKITIQMGCIEWQAKEINRQKAEIERLNGCVKSEEEVRTIMKSQMMPMVSEIVNEQFDVAVKLARAEAIKECLLQLEAEIESCKKYIREYDDREVQKAYCKGLESAYYVIKEMAGEQK